MLYVINLDGIRHVLSGRQRPKNPTDQILLPNVFRVLNELKVSNILVGISDHSNVSWDAYEKDAWLIEIELNRLLGNVLTDIRINFYHPEGSKRYRYHDRRKTNNQLVTEIREDFGGTQSGMLIGNSEIDRLLAARNNLTFDYVWDYFSWDKANLERTSDGYQWTKDTLDSVKDRTDLIAYRNIEIYDKNLNHVGRATVPKESILYIEPGPLYTADPNAIGIFRK